MTLREQLPTDWRTILQKEFHKPYWSSLEEKLTQARKKTTVYPPSKEVFSAFHACSFGSCRLLLLGQDPYHGPNQAHGLSFSVPDGIKIPPSLRNMYKERKSDLNLPIPTSGNLEAWSKRGILLLNAFLTVEEKKAGSHSKWGWGQFTDAVIAQLSKREKPLVFLMWGNFAKKKIKLIDQDRHRIVSSAHPSPLSAHRGFFGSKPYSRVNEALMEINQQPIDWSL
ncbi:MAG: uracil-DNA glycosylase [Deltaproteobacteria bacterium]|nr:uracil-DNA glycosylase [Deltaproteobacteria bacterium]